LGLYFIFKKFSHDAAKLPPGRDCYIAAPAGGHNTHSKRQHCSLNATCTLAILGFYLRPIKSIFFLLILHSSSIVW